MAISSNAADVGRGATSVGDAVGPRLLGFPGDGSSQNAPSTAVL